MRPVKLIPFILYREMECTPHSQAYHVYVPFVISLFYEAPWHSVMVVEILEKLHDHYKY